MPLSAKNIRTPPLPLKCLNYSFILHVFQLCILFQLYPLRPNTTPPPDYLNLIFFLDQYGLHIFSQCSFFLPKGKIAALIVFVDRMAKKSIMLKRKRTKKVNIVQLAEVSQCEPNSPKQTQRIFAPFHCEHQCFYQ